MATTTKATKQTKAQSTAKILNSLAHELNLSDVLPAISEVKPTDESIREYGANIMNFQARRNDFIKTLWNRIGRTLLVAKNWTNKLRVFKKEPLAFGETIEEIYVELAKPYQFDSKLAEDLVFKRAIPDVRTAFHTMNYQIQYEASTSQAELKQAFLTAGGMMGLIDNIIQQLYEANEYDEYIVTKYMVARMMVNGVLFAVEIPPVNKDNMLDIASSMRAISSNMEFRSYGPIYTYEGVRNFCLRDDQYILADTYFEAENSINVLASVFNVTNAELQATMMTIDGWDRHDNPRLAELFSEDPTTYVAFTPEELEILSKVPAAMVDRGFIFIVDNLEESGSIENPRGLGWNHYFTVFKTFSASPFHMAVVFVEDTVAVQGVVVNPAALSTVKNSTVQLTAQVTTTGMASKKLRWAFDESTPVTDSYITQEGLVIIGANETATSIGVTATSVLDPTKQGMSVITVTG